MGQVLHKRATTTQATRRAIQNSKESQKVLAKRYGINIKTVAKWKKRNSVEDLPMGAPKRSISLSREQEAAVVLFRRETLFCIAAFKEQVLASSHGKKMFEIRRGLNPTLQAFFM